MTTLTLVARVQPLSESCLTLDVLLHCNVEIFQSLVQKLRLCVCSYDELSKLLRRQMAFEHIFAAENLSVSDAEIQEEYDSAAREFEEQKQDFDKAKLREQVIEALKVK